jgi:hypothetical protein
MMNTPSLASNIYGYLAAGEEFQKGISFDSTGQVILNYNGGLKNNALLTLTDGSVVMLQRDATGFLYKSDGSAPIEIDWSDIQNSTGGVTVSVNAAGAPLGANGVVEENLRLNGSGQVTGQDDLSAQPTTPGTAFDSWQLRLNESETLDPNGHVATDALNYAPDQNATVTLSNASVIIDPGATVTISNGSGDSVVVAAGVVANINGSSDVVSIATGAASYVGVDGTNQTLKRLGGRRDLDQRRFGRGCQRNPQIRKSPAWQSLRRKAASRAADEISRSRGDVWRRRGGIRALPASCRRSRAGI